ncbi:MAG: hypothetical protein EA422_15860 [Gemmatimonadales bacterium]|nr:MAG: hypothetical protein EA422_15860 [Gemmatimonadales bacterium]
MTPRPFSPVQLVEGGPAGGSGAGPNPDTDSHAKSPGTALAGVSEAGAGQAVSRNRRLPPPAFPPGRRRDWVHRPRRLEGGGRSATGEIPSAAFLSTDEGHSGPPNPVVDQESISDEQVAEILESLAQEIRDYSGGRFLWKPGVPPLEGALRGLVSGYLRLGRREGERS